ncbi:hypothetical protein TWF281_009752 [Arthrobotrys megalospora]
MGQFPSHVPIPTAEERTEMLQLLGNISGKAGTSPAFTEEQLKVLYSPEYIPPNQDLHVIALTVVVMFWLVASVSLRFYSRWKFGAQTGPLLDDWIVLAATIPCIVYTIVNMYAFLWGGFGRYIYDLSIDQFNSCYKMLIMHATTFAVANTAVKVSILVLYIRIFDSMQTQMRQVVHLIIWAVIVFCPISIYFQLNFCKPFSAFWHIETWTDPNVKCGYLIGGYVVGVIRMLFDVIIFMLPLKHIWGIKGFSTRKKITVTLVFTFGLTACIASVLKLAFYPEYLKGDIVRGFLTIAIFECLEFTSAIVAACIPALLPMLKTAYRNTTSTIQQISSNGRSQINSTITHIGTGPVNHSDLIKLKGIKLSHSVSQTVEIQKEDGEDDTELILPMHDIDPKGDDDKDSKASSSRHQTSV